MNLDCGLGCDNVNPVRCTAHYDDEENGDTCYCSCHLDYMTVMLETAQEWINEFHGDEGVN